MFMMSLLLDMLLIPSTDFPCHLALISHYFPSKISLLHLQPKLVFLLLHVIYQLQEQGYVISKPTLASWMTIC